MRGGGGGCFLVTDFFSQKHLPGVLKRKQKPKKNVLLNLFFKNVPGVPKHIQQIFPGGILGCLVRHTPPTGGRAGSENDTRLPMTMTCDRLKFWSGPAWRSKIIIRKPWRRKNKKKNNKYKK